jgi:endonuclease/exonuclease/phosphatase family metal-dependent hydrolase
MKLVSFNIWRSGGHSLEATIEAIRRVGADIVALQECSAECAEVIATELGVGFVADDQDHAVLSSRTLCSRGRTKDPWGGLIVEVAPNITVANVHLFWDDYGPYRLHDGHDPAEVMARERTARLPGLEEALASIPEEGPYFLLGDFNAPSHLDPPHRPWPTSLACAQRGLLDAWYVMNPGGSGPTWTPLPEEEVRGVHDRIDFIHFHPRGGSVAVESAMTLDDRCGVTPWPSDHRAVVASFRIV